MPYKSKEAEAARGKAYREKKIPKRINNNMREDIVALLHRIKEVKNRKNWHPSKRYIFAGSYDVWESEANMHQANEMMDFSLNEAKSMGFIMNKSGKEEWQYNEEWEITDLGEAYLLEYSKR